jgi:DNA-binding transcriptional MerR regulator
MARKQKLSLYSKADLARYFQVPESTIRFYCGKFGEYLPSEGEGRKMRYTESCLAVLAFIKKQLPLVRTSSAMQALLAKNYTKKGKPKPPVSQPRKRPWPEATIPSKFNKFAPPDNLDANKPGLDSQPQTSALALGILERQSRSLERIALSLEGLSKKMADISLEFPSEAAPELAYLREQVRELKLLLDTAEKTHQQDMDQLRSWITRLAKPSRPPE